MSQRRRLVGRSPQGEQRLDAGASQLADAIGPNVLQKKIAERGVRPTLMAPLWRVAGFGLGAVTALMGERAAHACTEAVEEVIEEHYGRQSEELAGVDAELKHVVDRFRADEVAHKDTAVEQGARDAPGYPILSAVIRFGCRAAIRISEKI